MNTISELQNEITATMNAITTAMRKSPLNGDNEIKRLTKLHKTWEILEPKIREETLVLGATGKESSPTLVRYNAKFQVLVDEFKKFLKEITPSQTPLMRPLDMKRESFRRFLQERACQLRDGYEETLTERVTLKEIVKAYNRWVISGLGMKLDAKEIQILCDEQLGDSRGKLVWSQVMVFLDEDDMEDFIKAHNESMTKEES